MHTTRVFKNGNSQAVRIPADIAYERTDMELEIERDGDEIRIRPARRSLSGVLVNRPSAVGLSRSADQLKSAPIEQALPQNSGWQDRNPFKRRHVSPIR